VDAIKDLESVLTMVGGKVVYAAGPYSKLDPGLPPVVQDWLPVRQYGGYYKLASAAAMTPVTQGHSQPLVFGATGTWSLGCGCGDI